MYPLLCGNLTNCINVRKDVYVLITLIQNEHLFGCAGVSSWDLNQENNKP